MTLIQRQAEIEKLVKAVNAPDPHERSFMRSYVEVAGVRLTTGMSIIQMKYALQAAVGKVLDKIT